MLKVVGASSLNQLVMDAIPEVVRDPNPLNDGFLTDPIAESKYLEKLREIMKQNKLFKSYIGYGYYPTITPSVILRNVLENPGW
jgi:glycine dehydrogenase